MVWQARTQQAVMSAVLAKDPQPIGTLRTDAPADLQRLISRCLEKDAAHRFASTDDLRAELRAYSERRGRATWFCPRGVQPPYQSVIWFPGADVFLFRSTKYLATSYLFDFIPRSGRVLVYPIYKGTYERFEPQPRAITERRDRMIRWSQDIGLYASPILLVSNR